MTITQSAVLQAATALALVQIGEELQLAKINVQTGKPVRHPAKFSEILPDAIETVMGAIEKAEWRTESPLIAKWLALP